MDALEPLDDLVSAHGITYETYKPVYWNACVFDGRLLGLVSTSATVALHINKALVRESAPAIRAAGLDPNVYPRTIGELDAWADALTVRSPSGEIDRAGYLPLEPGWWIQRTPLWFGSNIYDQKPRRFTLTDPKVVEAFEWVQSCSKRLGKQAVADFRSGLGNFDSPTERLPRQQRYDGAAGALDGELYSQSQTVDVGRRRTTRGRDQTTVDGAVGPLPLGCRPVSGGDKGVARLRPVPWLGTFKPLWVPAWFGSAFNIFLLRQFFLTLPEELSEAARIDGCSELGIFLRVVLPLSRPALSVVALFGFMGIWNDFLGPLVYLQRPKQFTRALGLQNFQSQQGGTNWPQLVAASMMVILPVLMLFSSPKSNSSKASPRPA